MSSTLRDTLRAVSHRQSQRASVAMAYCSACGNPRTARTRIEDLENEVRVLTEQSVDALTRLADYEEEIRKLKAAKGREKAGVSNGGTVTGTGTGSGNGLVGGGETQVQGQSQAQHSYNASVDSATSASTASTAATGASGYGLGFASSWMGRKAPSSVATTAPSVSADVGDLQGQLAKEQAARVEAEKKADKLNGELEELSQNLFEQANEMVATERKARSKLEERVEVLEKRDRDKSRRLELLEGAMKRLERVRGLLAPPSPPY